MSVRTRRAGQFYIFIALLFLYAPLFVMVLMAFNRSRTNQLPFEFDTMWFSALRENERLLAATGNSIALALFTALVATAIGTAAAMALSRAQFRGKRLLQAMLIPPITIPWLILAIALLVMFFWLGVQRSVFTLVVGHITVQLPYTILVISARFAATDAALEEAAASLGAPPLYAFRRVTLPLILPGVLAAFVFAFAISFDNFVISYFLAPVGTTTLPVEIYTAIRTSFTPEVNAISAIVFVVSAVCVVIAGRDISFNLN
jgi:spermidine/putrescine transport system permease protein